MAKATPIDGQFLTLTASRFADAVHRADGPERQIFARIDLSDDRSFLSFRHRDLVDMVPDLAVQRGSAPGQGWIWVGAIRATCEIHVVLECLPSTIDLILGRCALELIDGAVGEGGRLGMFQADAGEPDSKIIDLDAARDARRDPAD